jgi:hypothetical protein
VKEISFVLIQIFFPFYGFLLLAIFSGNCPSQKVW